MLMVDTDIKEAIRAKEIIITPLYEDSFKPLAYVARLGRRALIGGKDLEIDTKNTGAVILEAGEFVLFTTLERFKLGHDIAGHMGIRTALARRGFILLAGMHIDPGWDGYLVLGGYNASPRKLVLDYATELIGIEFHRLTHPPESKAPSSSEQKRGDLPSMDKDYLRSMETQSLSKLGEEVRALSQSVAQISIQMRWLSWGLSVGFMVLSLLIGVLNLYN